MKRILKIVKDIAFQLGDLFPNMYFIFSRAFQHEHSSVLKGISAHRKNDIKSIALSSRLRRNIHRIEKGLTTPNGKNVFAEQFIYAIVNDIELLIKYYPKDIATIKWSKDVLDEYFSIVDHTSIIRESFNKYSSIIFPVFDSSKKSGPFAYDTLIPHNISFEEFEKLCHHRHAIRWYEATMVSRELIEKCIELALQSPSACNRQPFRFLVVDDQSRVKEISKLPMGANSFSDNIPVFIFLIGDLSAYDDARDRHLIYIDGGLAAMTFVLSLETAGLSSCIINWPAIPKREEELRKNIPIKEFEQCILCISVGYPRKDVRIPYSSKRVVKEVTSYL
jgi:nitroreductase